MPVSEVSARAKADTENIVAKAVKNAPPAVKRAQRDFLILMRISVVTVDRGLFPQT